MFSGRRLLLSVLIAITFVFLLRSAWVGDDPFITLRTVDNWVNGYGLTWNPPERVQAYTHPLWMFLLTGVYLFLRQGYFAVLLLSLFVSLMTFIVFLYFFSREEGLLFVFGWGALILSKSFLDFSTSGLENPLSHLVALLFLIVFLHMDLSSERHSLVLVFLAGLVALNRMDLLLLFFPAVAYVIIKYHLNFRGLKFLLIGFSPLIAWVLFSIVYYGFPFPNTAYAKLNVGLPTSVLVRQGILYFLNSLSLDPITLSVIFCAIILVFFQRDIKQRIIALGIVFYGVYVLWIGGDFMSGRFFSTIFLAAIVLLVESAKNLARPYQYAFASLLLFMGFLSPSGPVYYFSRPISTNTESYIDPNSQIADERAVYYPFTSLFITDRSFEMPKSPWVKYGKTYRANGPSVVTESAIGIIGYYAGPHVYIIDNYALGNALLARLPMKPQEDWRIGHFRRPLADGYYETLLSGRNQIKDRDLSLYYDKLSIIIRGRIWSWERFKTIWEMNTGQYNYLLEGYIQTHYKN